MADFGLSREINHDASNIRGTFGYLDPEYVSSRSFTKKSDVYSFGVLLFELITARSPQQGLMEYVELVRSPSSGIYLQIICYQLCQIYAVSNGLDLLVVD